MENALAIVRCSVTSACRNANGLEVAATLQLDEAGFGPAEHG
jgi:hypothetical protein